MTTFRRRDGFIGEKQINIPAAVLDKYIRHENFLSSLYITHIGFFPKAFFHYRERKKGCADNILFYCLGGKGYYETHQGSFTLTANHFAILPAGHPHRYQADIEDPWTIYWVHFSGNKLPGLNELLELERYIVPAPIKYDERFIQSWEEMYNALKESYSPASLSYANLCLYRFIALFAFPEQKPESHAEPDAVTKAIQFLKANIHKTLTVDAIAARFHYSASHFSAIFKHKTGMSPLEYFIQLKMHHACQLLDQSPLKIKDIALRVGYTDPYYFSRSFCKTMGVSPNKYRQKR